MAKLSVKNGVPPIAGKVHSVVQDSAVVTEADHLYTGGAGPCMIVVVHERDTSTGGVAHVGQQGKNYKTRLEAVFRAVDSMVAVLNGRSYDFFLHSGSTKWLRKSERVQVGETVRSAYLEGELRGRVQGCGEVFLHCEDRTIANLVYMPKLDAVHRLSSMGLRDSSGFLDPARAEHARVERLSDGPVMGQAAGLKFVRLQDR